jgi:spore coat protein H
MKQFIIIAFLVFVMAGLQSCYKEQVIYNNIADYNLELPTVLKLNGKECSVDYYAACLRFSLPDTVISEFQPFVEFQQYSEIFFEGIQLENQTVNDLGEVRVNREYEIEVLTNNQSKTFTLSFTNLPTVQIITPNIIRDEPKTIARLLIHYPQEEKASDDFFIGIEYRGQTSQEYDKKSFGIALLNSKSLNNRIAAPLFEMKSRTHWILDAMWIDPARLRNIVSFRLWKQMDAENYYGIEGEFVELYMNNQFHGLYCFSENINAESLGLQSSGAALYKAIEWEKGATRFEVYSGNQPTSYYWDGWEQKFPDPRLGLYWYPLQELRQVVVNENGEVFSSKIDSLIDMDNFLDYYIFLNLVSAKDNTGKNTFLVKEGMNEKISVIPWDIDGSWGLLWDGSHIDYSSVLSNRLYNRLKTLNVHQFNAKLKQRWLDLRGNIFSDHALQNIFIEAFHFIGASDVIERENSRWGCNINIQAEQEFLIQWLTNRVAFLDDYFENL